MATETRETIQPYVVQPGDGEIVENLHLRIMATGARTGDTLFAAHCTNPGPGGPPQHIHHSHDEFYLVLQGRYRFKIGQDEHEGGPGMFVYVPRGTSHTFASAGAEEGRIFAGSLPSLDEFIRRMSALQTDGVDQREMADLFNDFDSEITGPPLVSGS